MSCIIGISNRECLAFAQWSVKSPLLQTATKQVLRIQQEIWYNTMQSHAFDDFPAFLRHFSEVANVKLLLQVGIILLIHSLHRDILY